MTDPLPRAPSPAPALLLALGAGLASALMAGTVATGSPLGLVLVYAAPLPLMIVGLGWHALAGLLAALVAALALDAAVTSTTGLVHLVAVGLPAAALVAVARGAPGDEARGGPAGALVLAAGAAAVLASLAGALSVADTYDELVTALAASVAEALKALGAPPAPEGSDPSALARAYAAALLPATAGVLMVLHLGALWTAGLVVRRSGRLPRPWPRLPELRLPRAAVGALALSALASLLPGYPGLAAELVATVLALAFALVGLASLHALSRGMAARVPLLAATWVATLVMGLPALALAGFGVAETLASLRDRRERRRGAPPTAPDS